MKESYVVCKIKQQDRSLILCNSNHLGYQYSTNLYIELEMDDSNLNPFKNALLKAMCAIGNADKVYDCTILNEDNKKYIVLPAPVFEKEGVVLLSLGAINEDKTILTTNQLKLFVDASNPIHAEIAVDKDLWEVEVLKVMEQWFYAEVEPLLNTLNLKAKDLQKIAEGQQIQLTELIENIQRMLSDGDFNGSSILHGNGIPNNEIGKENDLYLDVSITSETLWHIFAKEHNVWVDKGGMQSKDSGKILVGTDLNTAEPKTLFIQNITQAQAIAETRGIAVNEYDTRLPMNQVRISDEIGSQGLDEFINQKLIKVSSDLTVRPDGAIWLVSKDLNTFFEQGSFYCIDCSNIPIVNNGYLEVIKHSNTNIMQRFTDAGNGAVFQRVYANGWTTWKLIAGEVLLWSGNVVNALSVVSLVCDISMFRNLVMCTNGNWNIVAEITDHPGFISGSTSYNSGNNSMVTSQAIFQRVEGDNKQLKLNADTGYYVSSIPTGALTFTKQSIIKLIGRP